MKTISVAVCDDEKNSLEIIASAVKKIFSSYDVDAQTETFTNAKSLWTAMQNRSYNLLFLDINMPATDGVQFAEKISGLKSRPDIIFVSSNSDRVFDTFVVNPFGFVRKDKFLKDIVSVIERYVKNKMNVESSFLRFEMKEKGSLITIDISILKYVECVRNEQIFHMDQQENKKIYSRMNTLEEQLVSNGFIRIHKGYLVNSRYVKRFDSNTVTLFTGETLPVGRSRHDESMERYLEFIHCNGISIIG